MYSYDDLFLFTKVVEIGSFSQTGKLLNISHSTISRRIQNLEDSLAVKLIYRDSNNFGVTTIGQQLYDGLRSSSTSIDSLMKSIILQKHDPQGTIRVVLPTVVGLDWITPKLIEFSEKWPKINLEISYQNIEIDLVKHGFDLGVVSHIPKQQAQRIKNIFSANVVFCCTQKYAEIHGIPTTPEDLSNHLVTGFMQDDFTIPKFMSLTHNETGKVSIIPMPRRIAHNNALHSQKLLKTDKVIVAIFDYMQLAESSDVIRVLPDYHLHTMKFYLIHHPHEKDIRVRIFSKFIEDCFVNDPQSPALV